MITERQKNKLMDRAFDAACLNVKGETEWANQILARLKNTYSHPDLTGYVQNLFDFYVNMVSNNQNLLVRADYMIEHKDSLKLQYK